MAWLARMIAVAAVGVVARGARADGAPEAGVQAGRDGPPESLDATTWTLAVGFEPDLPGTPESGTVVGAANVEEYRACIPDSLATLVRDHGLSLDVAAYRSIHPSRGYMEATRAAWGRARAVETRGSIRTRGIEGYAGGLPFPRPKTGLEAVWDQFFAYQGDDGWVRFRAYWISASRGVERTEDWSWSYIVRGLDRTDLDPRPHLPDLEARGIRYVSLAACEAPDDKAGTLALMVRHDEPVDQRGFLWVPALRRALKMVFGAPGVPWNASDMLFEDIRGLSGHPEWWDWTLVGTRTILAPMHAGVRIGPGETEKAVDFGSAPHWNPRIQWEPRPVYVVEGRPRFWTSLYGRVVLYVDAETFLVPLKEGHGRDGSLRKVVLHAFNASPDEDSEPPPLALALAVDLRRDHATLFATWETRANVGLRAADFSQAALLRMGR